MTGRDLIIYIMTNHLEDEELFKDGKVIGFLTVDEAAVKLNIGSGTVRSLFELGRLSGIKIGDSIYICNFGGDYEKRNCE